MIDLDQRCDCRIFAFPRPEGNTNFVLQGISLETKGSFQVTIDTFYTRNQTIVLQNGRDWELVIEVRPRKLSELEREKLK
jgi:hypothetical protein